MNDEATQAAIALRRRAATQAAKRIEIHRSALLAAVGAAAETPLKHTITSAEFRTDLVSLRDLFPDLPNISLLASDQF